ncbi:MAG: hypothetical protein GX968_01215 [Tissierellia bacterium]|nr:hypothetical protein [Tissierellia bacterium]
MEQTVENKNKSGIKTFFVIILFVVLVDLIIFIMNKFTQSLPYITTIFTVVLVVLSCSYILIKYFSKYLYIIDNGQIIFYMLIGKRKFESLRIDLEDLVDIKPYIDKTKRKPDYKFIYDKNQDKVYIGRYKDGENISSFLFSPNEKILRELKKE